MVERVQISTGPNGKDYGCVSEPNRFRNLLNRRQVEGQCSQGLSKWVNHGDKGVCMACRGGL